MEIKCSPQLVMERRKRVCEKRNQFSSEPRKKRASEPRPHPPDCLNKRYWDDVRAGRIPEPAWTAPMSSVYKQKGGFNLVAAKAPNDSREPFQQTMNQEQLNNFNNELFPNPFHFTPIPILPFLNPLLNMVPPVSHFGYEFPRPSIGKVKLVLVQKQCIKIRDHFSIPISSNGTSLFSKKHIIRHSASDEEVDRIVNDHFLSKQSQIRRPLPDVRIIPFPLPIPIILPLTSDFIYNHFGCKTLSKK